MHRLVPANLMVSVASGLLAFTACSPASSLGGSPSSPAPAQSTSVSAAPANTSTAPTVAATGPTAQRRNLGARERQQPNLTVSTRAYDRLCGVRSSAMHVDRVRT